MALVPAKKEQGPPKPTPWGFNANSKTKEEVNKEEIKQKQDDA